MGIIGIICNPQSGKDIRRLVTTATTIDDAEKQNILERIVRAVLTVSDHQVCVMPDRFGYGDRLLRKLRNGGEWGDRVDVLAMRMLETGADSTAFAQRMAEVGANVLIVMGGDGTNRMVAKGCGDTPIISVSTGTNNVFPEMLEGTVVGLAAAAVASGCVERSLCMHRAKRIELCRNQAEKDIALVDVVFCRQPFIGSRAIWNYEEIEHVVATRCHPASIGFSAMIGTSRIVTGDDDFGASADFGSRPANAYAPIGAGSIQPVHIENCETLPMGRTVRRTMPYQGTIALDGEREMAFNAGDEIAYRIARTGPLCIDVAAALESAMEHGMFQSPLE